MVYITCEHPIEKIRVVWHIVKRGVGFYVTEPRAHCIECNSGLQDHEPHAKVAIDLVMVAAARKEKESHVNEGSKEG